jgi:hypothetical protein
VAGKKGMGICKFWSAALNEGEALSKNTPGLALARLNSLFQPRNACNE